MKISKRLMCLAFGATLSLSAQALTGTGSGVRGGGHAIDVDSTPYLMDLVSKSVCEWKPGSELIEELPSIRQTLKNLDKIDWYFAGDLKEEISHMNFCMTGALYKVSPYDWGSVAAPTKGEKTRQAGYRLYENAYIDTDIYRGMNEVNKSMLIIHEVMHSYFLMNTEDRSLKLRSMVNTLDKVRSGEMVIREKLHYSMRMNQVAFPLTVASLDQKAVTFLKGSIEAKKEIILKTKNVDTLIDLNASQIDGLTSYDQSLFGQAHQRYELLKDGLLVAMQGLSPEALRVFLNETTSKKVNFVKIALNNFYMFSEDQKNVLLQGAEFDKMLEKGFDEILNEKLKAVDFLILSSVEFQKIVTGQGREVTPVVRLQKTQALPEGLNWLVETIIVLEENNKLDALSTNEKFYRAVGLKSQKEQVKAMPLKIERERLVALETLDNLSSALVVNLFKELHSRVSAEKYDNIIKQINVKNF